MKIRAWNQNVADGAKEPVLVILSPADKDNIANMHPDATIYCSFPDGWTSEDIKWWLKSTKSEEKIHVVVE